MPDARSVNVSSSIVIVTSALDPAGAGPLVTLPAFLRSIVQIASLAAGDGPNGFVMTITKTPLVYLNR